MGRWFERSIFYHIYPMGFCGASVNHEDEEQAEEGVNRIHKIVDWITHMKKLGIDAVYLGPVFESDSHGYDTRDYGNIDRRLGTNADFMEVCEALHKAGIRVILDGVFNHVGRGFWAFQDVLANREQSAYKDWFYVDFNGNGPCDDGLWYEGWEGHFNLVKLNLKNPQVVDHLLYNITKWTEDFKIDGLRLDVAYLLDEGFLRTLRNHVKSQREDFFLLGEAIHGDYNRIVNDTMLDSCTNYECYKGIHSSFNEKNLFEIAYSLNRQSGPEQWTLYKGIPLFNFVDNHDVNRIASTLKEQDDLKAVYGLLFAMPGIPSIYYGSEWGITGVKENGNDGNLRPSIPKPEENALTEWIGILSNIYKEQPALASGNYRQILVNNKQLLFERAWSGQTVIAGFNCGEEDYLADIPDAGSLLDLITGKEFSGGKVTVPAHGAVILREIPLSN